MRTPREFSELYDELYDKACNLFKKYNPCEIRTGTCLRGRLLDMESFCCEECQYLSPTGCTVKSIWCRLWTCHQIEESEDFLHELRLLSDEVEKVVPQNFRCSKEDAMRRLYGTMDSAVQVFGDR